MLRLAPHLVKGYMRAEPVGFGFGFEPAYRGWTTKDRTVSGHIGRPQDATAEKGAKYKSSQKFHESFFPFRDSLSKIASPPRLPMRRLY